jgi:signal peptidase I
VISANILIYSDCVEIMKIRGSSMFPALHDGDYWIAAPEDRIERFDIVCVQKPGEVLAKRVVGLPGEEIVFIRGDVYIDGEPLDEPHIPLRKVERWAGKWKMGPGEFFVMGDNRPDSHDSRHFGAVKRSEITCVLWFRFWRR